MLSVAFSVSFNRKEDDFVAIRWAFRLNKYELTLEYNIYNGILLFPTKGSGASKRDNEAVVQLASVLEGKLMNLGLQNKLV